jgi:hypothetical protein
MPATAGTRHLVDAVLLGALPPRAVFINPGRGAVVDEQALAAALTDGRLAGGVLDVFQQEPLPPGHVFWRTPNLLITSHTAALSFPEDIALASSSYRRSPARRALRYQSTSISELRHRQANGGTESQRQITQQEKERENPLPITQHTPVRVSTEECDGQVGWRTCAGDERWRMPTIAWRTLGVVNRPASLSSRYRTMASIVGR